MNANSTSLIHCLRKLVAPPSCADVPDPQLLERFLTQRSEAAFAALVRRHGPMVLSVCRRILHHTQDAEDAFQATFLVLARKAGSIRKHESVGSWLHGVAYRVSRMSKNKETRRRARQRGIAQQQPAEARDDIHWHELRLVLDEELGKLPEKYRTPLVLCYLEGRTRDEAAKQLGVSKAVFRRRLEYGRDQLGRQLARRGLTLSAALSAPLLADAAAQAALPPLLIATTVRAGLASALGNTVSGILSDQVVALAESGASSLLAKKASIAVILLASLTLGVGSLLAYRAVPSRTFAKAPAAPPPQSPPARSASKDQAIEIKGRVLDPEGKPFAGAHLFLLANGNRKNADDPPRATADKDGHFRFRARSAGFGPQGKAVLAATAKGFGLDWIDVNAKSESAEITLRLVADDVPIEGRVLDLEGNPVAGATVQVRALSKRADGKDLAGFVETVQKYLKEGTPEFQLGPLDTALGKFQWQRLAPAGLDVPAEVTTGADGRYRLTGLGRERVVELAIRGPTIGHSPLHALTRNGPAKGWIPGDWGLYGARFDWLASPCKPIIGTIRDKRTGKPLAGITVGAAQSLYIKTKTDNEGRYRVLGAAKSKEYDIVAGEMPYFSSERHIADTPGLEPITVDLQLERGIIVRGRLTEATTGKPVPGEIRFVALTENPHLKDYTDASRRGFFTIGAGKTEADGSFAVPVIPGPGLLLVTADDVKRFAAAEDKDWQTTPRFWRPYSHAVAPIHPSEKDPKSTTCDIALEPARLLRGSVVGPDDRPLAGAYVAGCWPIIQPDLFTHEKLDTDAFTVGGLKPGWPRMLAFYHREKKLGKVHVLQGNETKSMTVRLEPLGAIAGRILDAKGRPWAGLNVLVIATVKDKSYPPELHWVPSSWFKLTRFEMKTDRDGKFRFDGLVPGLKYELFAAEGQIVIQPEVALPYRADDLTVESGKTKELGDLKSKHVPDK
jgi:RNA polymerase sigma factor (sigma-70 family)